MITREEIFQGMSESIFLLKSRMDFSFFCKNLMMRTIKPFHKEWCDLLQAQDRLAIAAPTGYGKTEIFGICYPIWQAYFFPKSQSLIVSKVVKGQSQNIIEEIKVRLEENELLRELIPDDKKYEWSKDKMICPNGSKINLSPYSISVRGAHVDYIFGDEIATYMDKQDDYNIWFRDVLSRVASKKGKVAGVSTPLEPGDLITLLINKKGWYSKIYAALVDKEGNPTEPPYKNSIPVWPEKHTFEDLMRIKDEQGEENFERNYQCNPKAVVAKSIFNMKDITYGYDEKRNYTHKHQGGMIFIGGDFAMSEHPSADKDAFVVIEKLADTMIIKHIEIHHGIPVDEKINRLLELCRLHRPFQVLLDASNVGTYVSQQILNNGYPAIPKPFGPKSRNLLLSTLKIVIGDRKLIIPYNKENFETIRLGEELTLQLIGFKEEKSTKGFTTYVSTATHDDIAMALALAVSGAEEQDTTIGGFASGNF